MKEFSFLVLSLSLFTEFALTSQLFDRQSSEYPPLDIAGPTPRDEWVTAYNQHRAAGRIPSFPPSVLLPSGGIQYPHSGIDPQEVCSWTISNCLSPSDIADAPDGMRGISFDDGPQAGTMKLLEFLKSINQTATHFMIGSRILSNTPGIIAAVEQGEHIAVHTWSHPMMTTMTDLQVLGEIGWTIQVIYDLCDGRVPLYWRPPYGDVDNRVRAIAQNVFGLQTVIWNQDTDDWCLTPQDTTVCAHSGPANEAALTANLVQFSQSPKSPGLIILEHEITEHSVGGFVSSYDAFQSAGWNAKNIPDLFDEVWYQNADGPFDEPVNITSFTNSTATVDILRPARNSSRFYTNGVPKPALMNYKAPVAVTTKSNVPTTNNRTTTPVVAKPTDISSASSSKASVLSLIFLISSTCVHLLNLF